MIIQPKTYVRAPGAIDAVRLPSKDDAPSHIVHTNHFMDIADWCDSNLYVGTDRFGGSYFYLNVPTPGGDITAKSGNWVIKDATGAFHVMKHDRFMDLYMELEP